MSRKAEEKVVRLIIIILEKRLAEVKTIKRQKCDMKRGNWVKIRNNEETWRYTAHGKTSHKQHTNKMAVCIAFVSSHN